MTTYIISDLHFDDQWICKNLRDHRFDSVEEMNKTLRRNCISKVDENDKLLFLGDIVGKNGGEGDIWKWYTELDEKIDVWVPGNHDNASDSDLLPFCEPFCEEVQGHWFRFKHKPHRGTNDSHWIVHGHEHNKKPDKFPFVDPEARFINVSASIIGYEPIAMDRIIDFVETGEQYKFAPDRQ